VARNQLHDQVGLRLAALDQRYTTSRRSLVEVLADTDRPMTISEILAASALPQSSAYRNLVVLGEAGVVHRVVATDDLSRFELSEALSGRHHHHLICGVCGMVADMDASPRLERALAEAAKAAGEGAGFEVTDHRIDLMGSCSDCR
jgi:Fe2+ or Zn2+ uptake regulation protein